MNVSREWAKLFLENWDRTVKLWDNGKLYELKRLGESFQDTRYTTEQERDQQEYARICCSWVIPNGFQEPHVVAEGG